MILLVEEVWLKMIVLRLMRVKIKSLQVAKVPAVSNIPVLAQVRDVEEEAICAVFGVGCRGKLKEMSWSAIGWYSDTSDGDRWRTRHRVFLLFLPTKDGTDGSTM